MVRLMTVLLTLAALAWGDIHWASSLEGAMALAKKENKKVMVVMTTSFCPWCRRLKTQTLKDPVLQAKISTNFIAVEVDRDHDTYPNILYTRLVPTTFFLTNRGELLYHSIGFKEPKSFTADLNEALSAH